MCQSDTIIFSPNQLQSNIQQLDATIAALKQQLRSTEEELRSEREHSGGNYSDTGSTDTEIHILVPYLTAELKTQIDHQHAKFKLADTQCSELQQRLDAVQHQHINTAEELADVRASHAQSAGDLERNIATLRSDGQQLLTRLAAADELAADAQSKLRATTEELDALRTEFVAYKVWVGLANLGEPETLLSSIPLPLCPSVRRFAPNRSCATISSRRRAARPNWTTN